jgi:twitching motility protein PilT
MPGNAISVQVAREAVFGILNGEQIRIFERDWELNFAYSVPDLGRFRVNVYAARGHIEAAFRIISVAPHTMKDLGLPAVVAQLCARPSGLILVTGSAGQGKTTTLAAMINQINHSERRYRIVTIEDPIEYIHENVNSVVVQREVGIDTKSFNSALIQALRQDPNIICIGEMRDLETITSALTAAETGHLVLATLHSPDAPQCIDRIVDVFASQHQQQIRAQLSSCLEGIICQKLLPRKDGKGRIVAVEVLIGTSAVKNIIRERKPELLYGVMQTSAAHGMILMDAVLRHLYEQEMITLETALSKARDPKNIRDRLE